MSSRRRTRMPGLKNRPSIADNQRLLKATKKGALILLRFIRLCALFFFFMIENNTKIEKWHVCTTKRGVWAVEKQTRIKKK